MRRRQHPPSAVVSGYASLIAACGAAACSRITSLPHNQDSMKCTIVCISMAGAVTLACTDAKPPQRTGPPSAQGPRAVALDAPLGTIADLGIGDSDCPADTTAIHDAPGPLVREYVRRDAADSLQTLRWGDGALTCVERASSDDYVVVLSSRVDSVQQTRDSARFLVHYDQAYTLAWDSTGTRSSLVPARRELIDTVVVLRTRKGWRIDILDGGAHRSAAGAGHAYHLSDVDRLRLDSLASRRGGK